MVVLEEHQAVAGGVVGSGDGDVAAELACGLALGANAGVEPRDVVVAVGQHPLPVAGVGRAVGGDLGEQLGTGGGSGVGQAQAAGLLIGVERRCDPATGEVLGSFALPRLGLAADGLEAQSPGRRPGGGSAASSMAAPCHGARRAAHLYNRLHQAIGEVERRLT